MRLNHAGWIFREAVPETHEAAAGGGRKKKSEL